MSELPQGWTQSELGTLADVAIGGTPSRDILRYWANNDLDGQPWVAISDLHGRVIESTSESITEAGIANSNVKLVKHGTVLMSFKLSLGRVAFAGRDLYTNEAIAAFLVNDQVAPAYLYYALPEAVRGAATDVAIKGATLNKKSLRKLLIEHPSRGTQEKIATILSTIDTAIEQTEALIEKYQHIKAGLMHDLFTRGVLPTGQLRPLREQAPELYQETAIGWIPREWQISSCGQCCAIDSGITLGPHRRPRNNAHGYLRVGNVYRDELRLDDITTLEMFPGEKELALKTFDLLVVEGHANRAEIGRCAMVHNDAEGLLFQNHLFRLRAAGLNPVYALLWMNSHHSQRYWERVCATSSGLNTINSKMLKAMPFFVPSREEQDRIASAAEMAKSRISGTTAQLDKLRQQKLGLMQDLLTGKVSVTTPPSQGVATP